MRFFVHGSILKIAIKNAAIDKNDNAEKEASEIGRDQAREQAKKRSPSAGQPKRSTVAALAMPTFGDGRCQCRQDHLACLATCKKPPLGALLPHARWRGQCRRVGSRQMDKTPRGISQA